MELRVTQGRLFRFSQETISRGFRELAELQESIDDGREVSKPSDDPVRAARAMRLRLQIQRNEQYIENVGRGIDLLQASTDSLQEVSDRLSEVRSTALAAASGTQVEESRRAFASEIDQALERLFTIANTRYDETPVFGGTATQQNPFTAERDAEGRITSVSYRGNRAVAPILVGPDERLIPTVSGAEAFNDPDGQFANLFDTLVQLRDDIDDVDGIANEDLGDAIRATLPALDRIEGSVLSAVGRLGARLGETESLRDNLRSFDTFSRTALSDTEDLDTVEAVLQLQQRQTSLQTAAAVAGQILNTNLLNFFI
ncbi:MAG: flagellar hook-associated protein FlgL [Planctomycetota bacterium]